MQGSLSSPKTHISIKKKKKNASEGKKLRFLERKKNVENNGLIIFFQ